MFEALRRNWGLFVLRGIVAVLFGVVLLAWPGPTLAVLVRLFGAYALVDGVFALAYAFVPQNPHRWLSAIIGVAGVAVGYLTFRTPAITAILLYSYIAGWAVVVGIAQIALGARLRRHVAGELSLIFGGIVSILFGALMIILPQIGVVALIWLISIFAILFGLGSIGLALRLHHEIERVLPTSRTPVPQA